jgi:MFS family permease
MDAAPQTALPVFQRRRARRRAYWNGAIWAIGNGLTSSTLVIYLAMELGVPGMGLGIGMIKAAPRIAGLLRLAAPALIAGFGSRKGFCLGAYLASGVVLLGLPLAAAPGWLPSPLASLAALVLLWCVYHLLEYLGTVALWSWLADLVPLRIRGRFIGRRQRWLVAGQAAAMLDAGLFTWGWRAMHPFLPRWIGYAVPAGVGACFMIASLAPLVRIPGLERGRRRTSEVSETSEVCGPRPGSGRAILAPLADRRFRRLVLFIAWFSLFNGLTQSVQYIYPYALGMTLFVMLTLETGTRIGQLGISPWMGRLADRFGNRPVMMVSLALTSAGLLFYLFTTPEHRWWFAGAWAIWIAYAGLNVCLPNLMLKLSPRENNTGYIATFDAASGLAFAAGALLGGLAYDRMKGLAFFLLGGTVALGYFHYAFLFGWATRSLGLLVLLGVAEPRGRAER